MAAQQQEETPAGELASSAGTTVILGALLSLVLVYSLALLLRTFLYSLRRQSKSNSAEGPPSTGKRQLCPSCAILHGRRSPILQQQQPRGADGLAHYQYPARNSTAGLNFKCSECSARLSKSTTGGSGGFYGTGTNSQEQHQIIFGKSKDSILVPDLVCTKVESSQATTTRTSSSSSSNNNSNNKLTREKLQLESFPCAGEQNLALDQQSSNLDNQDGPETILDFNYPPVTTRVLTDEKGHSIKIRIASPPPQRQGQLVELHRQHKALQRPRLETGHALSHRRDNLYSDFPFVSLASLANQGQAEEFAGAPGQRTGRGCLAEEPMSLIEVTANTTRTRRKCSMSEKRRWRSELGLAVATTSKLLGVRRATIWDEEEIEYEKEEEEEENEGGSESGGRRQRGQTDGAPIELFNDSNTSEFDDVPGSDSRQDTSLEFQQRQLQSAGCDSSTMAQRRANEQVMDADLRRANRLNLQLALLQSATQDSLGHQGAASQARRSTISSGNQLGLGGAQLQQHQQHFNHHHLPQSGVLHPASEFEVTQQHQQLQLQQQKPRRRCQSSQEEYDSGCGQAEVDSRRSSACLSSTGGGPEGGGGEPVCTTPTSVSSASANSIRPSLRVRITLLSRAKSVEQKAETQSHPTKASLFYTFGIGSLGRSRSLEETESEQHADIQQRATTREPKPDDLYEINLLESHNVLRQLASAVGANGPAESGGGRSSPTGCRGRRDSLLGVLGLGGGGGAGTLSPNAQRRSSIDGVFVRIFKQVTSERDQQQQQQQQQHQQHQQPAAASSSRGGHSFDQQDGVSLYSYSSLSPNSSASQRSDYVQLPLVKFTGHDEQQQQQQAAQGGSINFEQLTREGYKFTCRLAEFPLRVSLYQVSKRGGARFTLGHCILTPDDWQHPASSASSSDLAPSHVGSQHFWPSTKFVSHFAVGRNGQKRNSSQSSSTDVFETTCEGEHDKDGGSRDSKGSNNQNQDQDQGEGRTSWTLEYCLHQTILEAINSS